MMAAESTFTISSVFNRYQVYKDIWDAAQGEVLPCRSDGANSHDPLEAYIYYPGVYNTPMAVQGN